MNKIPFVILFFTLLISCKQTRNKEALVDNKNKKAIDYDAIYFQVDSSHLSQDTLLVYISKLDTIIQETGIFTYLQVSYPLMSNKHLNMLTKKAMQYSYTNDSLNAYTTYNQIVHYYHTEYSKELKNISDGNEYEGWQIHAAIECAYAYDMLGKTDSALMVLKPHLAYYETQYTRAFEYFIQLCLKKYGKAKVINELAKCVHTIQYKKEDTSFNMENTIQLFNTPIGIQKLHPKDIITKEYIKNILIDKGFYKPIK